MNNATIESPPIYLPKNYETLENRKLGSLRVGLQGWPGTGHTHSSLTFPNPFVLDFDNKLAAHYGKTIPNIPFWDGDYVSKVLGFPPPRPGKNPCRQKALVNFLKTEAPKFNNNQTIILDSWTAIQEAIDCYNDDCPVISKKTGELDEFAFWGNKLTDSREIMRLIKGLKCNVVVNFHELAQRDPKTNMLLDKVRPLQQGSFVAEIASHFTFFFRTLSEEKKDKDGKVTGVEYYWQVESNNTFEALSCPKFPEGVFKVEPNFSVFEKYLGLKL